MESLPNKASEIFNSIIQDGPRTVPLKSGAVLKVEIQERIAQGVVWSLAHYAKGDDEHDPKVLFYVDADGSVFPLAFEVASAPAARVCAICDDIAQDGSGSQLVIARFTSLWMHQLSAQL